MTATAQSGFSDGIASGDITQTSAVVWTRADAPGPIILELAADNGFAPADVVRTIEEPATRERDLVIKHDLGGLTPDTIYFYRFRRPDAIEQVSRTGVFRTLPPVDRPAALRFVFSGDTNFVHAPFGVVAAMVEEQNVDAFIWFGDTVYADVPAAGQPAAVTLDQYRQRYRQIRSDAAIQDALARFPIYVGGDDHEVANDFAGRDPGFPAARLSAGLQAFFEYMPIREQGVAGDPFRMYRRFKWGSDVEFFFLDERQYRQKSARADCGENPDPMGFFLGPLSIDEECQKRLRMPRDMLGPEQTEWFKQALLESTARVKFVINNVPFSFVGVFPYDRWDGYDAQRKELLEFIHENEIPGVILLTTDIHANAYIPDVATYFRANRPEYRLKPDVTVAEIIVGPLGNETMRDSLEVIANRAVGGALSAVIFGLGEAGLIHKLKAANGIPYLDNDLVSYAVIDVTAEGNVEVAYRGVEADDAHSAPAGVSTHYSSRVEPPRSMLCSSPVFFIGLAGFVFLKGARARADGRS